MPPLLVPGLGSQGCPLCGLQGPLTLARQLDGVEGRKCHLPGSERQQGKVLTLSS